MKGCIYWIRNTINNKLYIGQTEDWVRRYKEHKSREHNIHLIRAYAKYGFDNFEFKILQVFSSDDEITLRRKLNEAEVRYIKYFDSHNPKKGYNQTDGGDGINGFTHSEESKKKMSQAKKGFAVANSGSFKKGCIPWNKGKSYKADTTNKPIAKYSLDGDYITTFRSLKEASESVGGLSSNMRRAIKKTGKYKNYEWRYV